MSNPFRDPELLVDFPSGILTPDEGFNPNKKTVVIYTNCTGRTMIDYFNMRPHITNAYNRIRIETGPIVLARLRRGFNAMESDSLRRIFGMADVLICNNTGVRHGDMALSNVRNFLKSSCQVITFTAANTYLFWPVCKDSGKFGVFQMMDRGATEDDVWRSFLAGTFDPMFNLRRRIEMGRIHERDSFHSIKIGGFVEDHLKTYKLWMADSHPTFTLVSHIGSEAMRLMGLQHDTEDEILSRNYSIGVMEAYPETDYEFSHFGFSYPKRHTANLGGLEFYRKQVADAAASVNNRCGIGPSPDAN